MNLDKMSYNLFKKLMVNQFVERDISKLIKEFSDKSDIIARLLMELHVTKAKLQKLNDLSSKESYLKSNNNFLKLNEFYYLVKDKDALDELLRDNNNSISDEVFGFPEEYPAFCIVEKQWVPETNTRHGYRKLIIKSLPIEKIKQLL